MNRLRVDSWVIIYVCMSMTNIMPHHFSGTARHIHYVTSSANDVKVARLVVHSCLCQG